MFLFNIVTFLPFQGVPTQDVCKAISKIYSRDEGLTLGLYSIADIYVKNNEVKVSYNYLISLNLAPISPLTITKHDLKHLFDSFTIFI